MSDSIQTQAELESLLNSPERLDDYVTSRAKEVLGETVKEQMAEALRDSTVKRPPMSEEAITDGVTMQGKEFGGGWQGKDETKIDLAREAKGMDGQFTAQGTWRGPR